MTYQAPEMTIVLLQDEDVLTLSIGTDSESNYSHAVFGVDFS